MRNPGSRRRLVSRTPIRICLLVLLLAATVSATFVITKHRIFPYAYLNRAELRPVRIESLRP